MTLKNEVLTDKYLLKYTDIESGEKIQVELNEEDLWRRISKGFDDEKFKLTNGKSFYDYFQNWQIILQGSPLYFVGNPFQSGSLSNCVVIESPEDSYDDILRADRELVYLMINRCGVGLDLSKIRPKGAIVNGPAMTAPGVCLYSERYSNTTREVATEGRRGALMLTLDCRHPDVLDFISMKDDLTKVTGANVSVMMRNELWDAYLENPDSDYILRFPVNSEIPNIELPYNKLVKHKDCYFKRVSVSDIILNITKYAHKNGEPGIINYDLQKLYSPSEVYYPAVTTNPCSEIMMGENDCCRLLVVNMMSCIKVSKSHNDLHIWFDWRKYSELCSVAIEIGDYLIDLEIKSLNNLINRYKDSDKQDIFIKLRDQAKNGRRLGSGFNGLADVISWLGMTYGDDNSLNFSERLAKVKLQSELQTEIELAKLYGAFPDWDKELDRQDSEKEGTFLNMVKNEFPGLFKSMMHYGRRHCSWSTVAPTGSISIISEVSGGIQSLFRPYNIRRKKVLDDRKYDFTDQNGDKWTEHFLIHPKLVDYCKLKYDVDLNIIKDIEKLDEIISYTPYFNSTSDKIDPVRAVKLQGIFQKCTTHSISSTINLPESSTVEQVLDIYLMAYTEKCKGITVYRNNSRTGVLVDVKTQQNNQNYIIRPEKVRAKIFEAFVDGKAISIVIGEVNNLPYEIFDVNSVNLTEGDIIKDNKNYLLNDEILNSKVGLNAAFNRLISMELRHKVPLKFIIKNLNKITNISITSYIKAISRILSTYLDNEEKAETLDYEFCPNQGEKQCSIEYSEGCVVCRTCGYSGCH